MAGAQGETATGEELKLDAQKSARSKIRSLEELAGVAKQARQRGQTVVLAHGAFDLLHMGHVRHLEQARHQGDHLIVTVTADRFVNKGPGRPVFSEGMRAEMLAALSYVDWVGINDAPTAENIIEALKPDVYVKGSDYARAADDITGKIGFEQRAVEAYGGRIHFTEDITFSSSSLLNRHFDVFKPEVREFLDQFRDRYSFKDVLAALESVADMRVVLVGDTIIDEYQYVQPMGKTPKENLIPTLYREHELFAGGVIAAANHAAAFCRQVDIVTCFGEHDSHEDLVRSVLKPNVSLHAVYRHGVPTTRKCRYVDVDYFRKLFEVYFMEDSPISGGLEADFLRLIERQVPDADVVIVTDFGHGLITPAACNALQHKARFVAINAQSNSANMGFNLITKYSRADYVCIDAPEARLAVANKYGDIIQLVNDQLATRMDCSHMIVTHGRHGCITYDGSDKIHRVPAFTDRALDTMGAGDAFLAVTSPLVAAGVPMDLVGFIGNAVGAIKVGIVGHRQSVEKIPLLKYLSTLLK